MNRRTVLSLAGLGSVSRVLPVLANETGDARKAVVQRYIDEAINGGNLDILPELFDHGYTTSDPADKPGIDALRERLTASRAALATLYDKATYTLETMVAEGETVMGRGRVTVTKDGKEQSAGWFMQCDFRDGKIVKSWSLVDVTAL